MSNVPVPIDEIIAFNQAVVDTGRIPHAPPMDDSELVEVVNNAAELIELWKANPSFVVTIMSWGAIDCLREIGDMANAPAQALDAHHEAGIAAVRNVLARVAAILSKRWSLPPPFEQQENDQ